MEDNDKVIVIDENGNEVEATILNIIEIDNNEYLLFSVDANEEDANLFVNKIVRDANGEETTIPIEHDEERNMVFNSIKEYINNLE